MDKESYAPGWPGIPPRWTSSAKSGLGTALNDASRVWFTLSHGILNEVYYRRIDQACIRDMGLIVTDGKDFFSEEKRHTRHRLQRVADHIPAYRLLNRCEEGRYEIEKEVFASPLRDAVLQRARFTPLTGRISEYRLYVLLAPHLANRGSGNTGWTGEYKGVPMLFAQRAGHVLALACSVPWVKRSIGFVGVSDGWQDLSRHKKMEWEYTRAENGNIALVAEVDLAAGDGSFELSLGFGESGGAAGHRALAALADDFLRSRALYIREWKSFEDEIPAIPGKLYRSSATILRTHFAKQFPGGVIASLSVPWGFSKGDDDLGGYHLVWPRDLVEAAGGLLACGRKEEAAAVVQYLRVTQEAEGDWPQNMWLDGSPYWTGLQMDETAFPVLLVDKARREGALRPDDLSSLWPMVRAASGFLVRSGPVTPEDRWEQDPGYSPFTLAVEIAALLAAADLAEIQGKKATAEYLREKADAWNANVERWTYVEDTEISRGAGVEGYYIRIAPPEEADAPSPLGGFVPIKNRPPGATGLPPAEVISPDALALVRFGLRAPDDPRIVNTLKVIDRLLKIETPYGPVWRRYTGDQYGEHDDGAPFDGRGKGRAWPLLTGERAHYELAAGRRDRAEELRRAMEAFSDEGLIPEQVWDSPDIPERRLFFGRPSGSAMPLVWAHAEYIKLCRSLHDGKVFDTPPQALQRYAMKNTGSPHALWSFRNKLRSMAAGKTLRVELLSPGVVRWTLDGWRTVREEKTHDTGLDLFITDLPTARAPAGTQIQFTFYWPGEDRWEGTNFEVRVGPERPDNQKGGILSR